MTWEVIVTDECAEWLESLNERTTERINAAVQMLSEVGPGLKRPLVGILSNGSNYPNMKELRVQVGGQPIRILFCFDPKQRAILLLGGNKKGDNDWTADAIRAADALYAAHLKTIATK